MSERAKYEQIERYLAGKLDSEELITFEDELKQNPSLKKEVALHRGVSEAITEQDVIDFRSTVQEVIRSMGRQKPSPIKIYLKWAAVILLLVVSGLVINHLYFRPSSNQEIFEKYFSPYDNVITGRTDVVNDQDILLAFEYYDQNNYAEALKFFGKIDQTDKPLLSIYEGICHLKLLSYTEAHHLFDKVPHNSLYFVEAQWYKALTFVKQNKMEDAKGILKTIIKGNPNSSYAKKAQEILREQT